MTTIAAFAAAPFLIDTAPYESTMGLVQKIFYFHVPAGIVMFLGGVRLRRRRARSFLFRRQALARTASPLPRRN